MPASKTLRIEWGNEGLPNEYRITDEGGVQYRVSYPGWVTGGRGWSRWRDSRTRSLLVTSASIQQSPSGSGIASNGRLEKSLKQHKVKGQDDPPHIRGRVKRPILGLCGALDCFYLRGTRYCFNVLNCASPFCLCTAPRLRGCLLVCGASRRISLWPFRHMIAARGAPCPPQNRRASGSGTVPSLGRG
jgi:hypothetical protein